jgi:hypothetical protein
MEYLVFFAFQEALMRKLILTGVITAFIATAGVAYAQKPNKNVSAAKHPNIAAAQTDLQRAWERILAAQKANEFDLGGHAQKAKDAIDTANKELKLAAEAANK